MSPGPTLPPPPPHPSLPRRNQGRQVDLTNIHSRYEMSQTRAPHPPLLKENTLFIAGSSNGGNEKYGKGTPCSFLSPYFSSFLSLNFVSVSVTFCFCLFSASLLSLLSLYKRRSCLFHSTQSFSKLHLAHRGGTLIASNGTSTKW